MNRLSTRYAALLRLPACVGNWEADGAGPVTGGPRVLFGEEEDTVGDIAAPADGAQRGGAGETTVDAPTEGAAPHPSVGSNSRIPGGTPKHTGPSPARV